PPSPLTTMTTSISAPPTQLPVYHPTTIKDQALLSLDHNPAGSSIM
ncbi:hypothetical protein SOVF_090040, partial [Spinacia oleracea]